MHAFGAGSRADSRGDRGVASAAAETSATAAEVARVAQQEHLDERLLAGAAQDANAVMVFFLGLAVFAPSPSTWAQLSRYIVAFSCFVHVAVQKLEERSGPVLSSRLFPPKEGSARKRSLVRLDNTFQLTTVTVGDQADGTCISWLWRACLRDRRWSLYDDTCALFGTFRSY